MAKKGKKKHDETSTTTVMKEVEIKKAAMRDGFCDYTWKINTGSKAGEVLNAKGAGIAYDSLRHAFRNLDVHLAILDGAFKNRGIEFNNLGDIDEHELLKDYVVNKFEIKGSSEDESIILTGTRFSMEAMGWFEIKTPAIRITNGQYKWYNELMEASKVVRDEVEAYKNGACTPPAKDFVDPDQTSILDAESELIGADDDFSNNKI